MATDRRTFHDIVTHGAWQRQRRDVLAAPAPLVLSPSSLKQSRVRPVSYAFARRIIVQYEWLGTMAHTSHHYGMFFGVHCAGVCCVGTHAGANRNAALELGLATGGLGYLARGACVSWAPPGTNSKLVAWTCRLFHAATGLPAMIAYADTDAGEIGTIYQACGWYYIGQSAAKVQWVAPTGRVYEEKLIGDLHRAQGHARVACTTALLEAGWTRQRGNRKHRYVALLDKTHVPLRTRLEALALPYPKRVRSIGSDAGVVQTPQGGAPPTLTLLPEDDAYAPR